MLDLKEMIEDRNSLESFTQTLRTSSHGLSNIATGLCDNWMHLNEEEKFIYLTRLKMISSNLAKYLSEMLA
ncbi:MAG: hypothetical protein J0H68_05165 [Sphingobacteriia bacterium]|nr:hypothetical protein [Sphingobacteriia bacterium]